MIYFKEKSINGAYGTQRGCELELQTSSELVCVVLILFKLMEVH